MIISAILIVLLTLAGGYEIEREEGMKTYYSGGVYANVKTDREKYQIYMSLTNTNDHLVCVEASVDYDESSRLEQPMQAVDVPPGGHVERFIATADDIQYPTVVVLDFNHGIIVHHKPCHKVRFVI